MKALKELATEYPETLKKIISSDEELYYLEHPVQSKRQTVDITFYIWAAPLTLILYACVIFLPEIFFPLNHLALIGALLMSAALVYNWPVYPDLTEPSGVYVITSHKAVVLTKGELGWQVNIYMPEACNTKLVTENRDGSKNLYFRQVMHWREDESYYGYRASYEGFESVPDIHEAEMAFEKFNPALNAQQNYSK